MQMLFYLYLIVYIKYSYCVSEYKIYLYEAYSKSIGVNFNWVSHINLMFFLQTSVLKQI